MGEPPGGGLGTSPPAPPPRPGGNTKIQFEACVHCMEKNDVFWTVVHGEKGRRAGVGTCHTRQHEALVTSPAQFLPTARRREATPESPLFHSSSLSMCISREKVSEKMARPVPSKNSGRDP